MPRQFLVVDDHPMIQRAMSETLSELEPDCEVLCASGLSEALHVLGNTDAPVDLILFDLRLPDAAGLDGLMTLRDRHPECRVVVLSGEVDAPMIARCLDIGAAGYIPKSLSSTEVHNALRVVAAGGIYVPPQILATSQPIHVQDALHPSVRSADPRRLGLTDRQLDVLRLMLRGLPNKLICRELGLAEGTVKVHVSAVLRALGARNRTQAVIAAARIGLQFRE